MKDPTTISLYGLAAAAMTGNLSWAIPGQEPWALIKYLSTRFHYFPSLHTPNIIKESVTDPWLAAFLAAARDNRLDVLRWINESGKIKPGACVESLQWASHHGNLTMVKWLIEESGHVIDCRELAMVRGGSFFYNPMSKQLNECRDYLVSVAETQELVGVEECQVAKAAKQISQKPWRRL